MSLVPNMASREVCDLIFVDFTTKVPFLNVDYANTTSIGVDGTTVFATGGAGAPRRIAFNGEKTGSIKFETQIQPFKLYSLISGAAIGTTGTLIERKVVTCGTAGKLNIPHSPAAGSVNVFASTDDCGTVYKGTWASAAATEPATGYDITFTAAEGETSTITKDAIYIVYYLHDVSTDVQVLKITNTTFPKDFIAYGSTFYKTEGGEEAPYKWIAYKCHPQNAMELTFANSGDPATLTVTCELLADPDNNILDMILIEE